MGNGCRKNKPRSGLPERHHRTIRPRKLIFLERLAALVPRPRTHLMTYPGVLASAAAWRDLVVPGAPVGLRTSPRTPRQHLTWAELLRRVFAIDVLICPRSDGPRKLIALIHDGLVVRKILEHLGLPAEPPPRGGAWAAVFAQFDLPPSEPRRRPTRSTSREFSRPGHEPTPLQRAYNHASRPPSRRKVMRVQVLSAEKEAEGLLDGLLKVGDEAV